LKKLKIYVAGKVNPNSCFGKHDWRDPFCEKLSRMTGYNMINLDPTKANIPFVMRENDPFFVFGRDSFMISKADIVIVNLTDDISVGGSQEMLIAKYFNKILVGIVKSEGKFKKTIKVIQKKEYHNYLHPFVAVPCDYLVENIDELANLILHKIKINQNSIKKHLIKTHLDEIILGTIEYYKQKFLVEDTYLHDKID
jgi:hypothetical protein